MTAKGITMWSSFAIKINIKAVLTAAVFCLSFVPIYSQKDHVCTTPQNSPGKCIPLIQCPILYNFTSPLPEDAAILIRNSFCGVENRRSKVCCPSWTPSDDDGKPQSQPPKEPPFIESPPELMHPRNFTPSNARIPDTNENSGVNNPETRYRRPSSKKKLLPTKEQCGRYDTDKVLGGRKTLKHEYPWSALLQYTSYDNILEFHCGGTLISSRYVLTAAHCLKGKNIPSHKILTSVRLGEWNISSDVDCDTSGQCSDTHIDVPVDTIQVHENYVPENPSKHNDIGLVRLAYPVLFTDFIKPICLPSLSPSLLRKNYVGEQLFVVGWGRTETELQSNVKLQVRLPVVDQSVCSSIYKRNDVILINKQLCAGGQKGKDSCSGDSGGGLVSPETVDGKSNWYLIGLVSFGPRDCGIEGFPAIYTRVSKFVGWIKRTIHD